MGVIDWRCQASRIDIADTVPVDPTQSYYTYSKVPNNIHLPFTYHHLPSSFTVIYYMFSVIFHFLQSCIHQFPSFAINLSIICPIHFRLKVTARTLPSWVSSPLSLPRIGDWSRRPSLVASHLGWGIPKFPKSSWLLTYTKSWSSTTGWFGGTPMPLESPILRWYGKT
jgi:hypothetical protein